jgi:replicative DNA helicase
MKDAITISVNRDIGVDYFSDPENRLKDLAATILPIPTGYVKIDEGLGGGLTRKEMLLVLGAPGYGKSISLSNLAKRLMKRKLNGVYITLELSEKVVAKRFDTMFSGIAPSQVLNNITETSIRIGKEKGNYGKLFIKRMPESSTNANHIRAYLKEFEIVNGFTPDFICLDYLDLMASCQDISAENFFARDKYISEELRSIANDFDLIMLTASQLNRGAQSVESIDDLGQSHIAGGISKINTADNVLAIYPSAQAKARGETKARSKSMAKNY